MAERLLLDVAEDGRVALLAWPEGEAYPQGVGEPVALDWPLDRAALDELRWYLEDYLRAPFGVYGERGSQVAGRLPEWGEQVFEAVFGAGPARDAYLRARARAEARGGRVELVVRSGAAEPLGWPWELMAEPGRPTPLALDSRTTVSRTLPAADLGDVFTVAGARLRVLMVISRPRGTRDVGYQMIARPLLSRLEAVRGQVDLVVLRPPTLAHLQRVLTAAREAGEPFQIVHFDGHGVFGAPSGPLGGAGLPVMYRGPGPQGMLAFEKPEGGSDLVPADEVARVLKSAQVPVVVLNACQSAVVGSQVEAAVATRLLQEGTAAVVAMAYSVYAVAAAEFMAAFYERLFAGDRVAEAVAAGRRRLAQRDLRPSPKGLMPLADWTVPVLYSRSEVRFPGLHTERPVGTTLEEMLDEIRERPRTGEGGDTGPEAEPDTSLEAVGEFVGRDALLYTLDVAARLQRVVVLHGPGGTGKTELAKAFGRWWRDTGALEHPDGVVWHSFEPGVASFGLGGVITGLGLRLFGAQFALLDSEERQELVERVLTERRLLLVWDNFESVHTMPDPTQATPPLPEPERDALRDFLARIAARGSSAVVVTSRTPETWLGPEARRLGVPGLDTEEAGQYADHLLAPYPDARPRRESPAFGKLMEWLDGHPLSMRIVLPHLDTTGPQDLLAGLQGVERLPDTDTGTADRTTSLAAGIAYSFTHLPAADQHALTALSLLHGVADADVLGAFSSVADVPEPFRGHTPAVWQGVLDRAAEVGLLTPLGARMYRIHPALPAYLTAHWRSHALGAYADQRTAATRAMIDAYAAFGLWLTREINSGDAAIAMALIGHHQRTQGSMLGHALDQGLWVQAQDIGESLDLHWDARGMAEEARAWADRARLVLETADGAPPDLDTPAGGLWLFLVGAQANQHVWQGQLEKAGHTYRQILDALSKQSGTPQQQARLGITYHQLGVIAHQRGKLDEAEDWYRQSLAIDEELGSRSGAAGVYHQLGIVAQERGQLDEAEDWYRRSLTINEELGNRTNVATSYHQLGTVTHARGQLEEAENWYHQALGICKELGDRLGTARAYHQLGISAQERGQLDEAEDWYRQSLAISDELGNRPSTAGVYHQLGIVAQERRQLDEAENWYRQSLAIHDELGNLAGTAQASHQLGIVHQERGQLDEAEDWYRRSLAVSRELGNRPATASSYGQLGVLAGIRNRDGEALEWVVRCVTTFDQFPHPSTGPGPVHLAELTDVLGIAALERTWLAVTGRTLPSAVRDFLLAEPPTDTATP
ncbi:MULTISPECIES: CHAT domain-containing tetratricopeptide repeat protein [Streptomyces]|uniref:Tetratricopeptide repeat protein n=1 Tax=Streptomyces solicathayae TaxID=3081768 RepID=A0ABZ0LYG9_9ACTN|nr:tetratricopeptide repeat protein [Streptomyces sp. HUAS YS2]WOX23833.1 tetratricopeptide repeat protein [Streptomyces sp. HUAS YS2]